MLTQPCLSSRTHRLICILHSDAPLIFAFLALQPMGYKLHCETDPEKALKWVYESVVLPDIGELAASSAYKSISLCSSTAQWVILSVLCCIHSAASTT